jgi:O-antigen ligase
MDHPGAGERDRLAAWCGWIVVVAMGLTPLLAWLGPLGFAVVFGVLGLFSLPAIRIGDADRPLAVVLLTALIWAGVSTLWSPFHPSRPDNNTALKLALQLPLYWALVCAARRARPDLRRLALAVFAWGTAALGFVLLAEFALDAGIYERLHVAFYEPIRHDLAQTAMAHSSFVLALIWPVALAAGRRLNLTSWIALPMVAGAVTAGGRFGAEAPVLSVLAAGLAGLAALRWSSLAPRVMAGIAAVYFLIAPAVVAAVRATGGYERLKDAVELSWSMRLGFWSHAVDWIGDHPLRGWGLDASRMFSPGIVLHPHDAALQVWLELGAPGAVLAAAVWWLAFGRLARPRAEMAAAAVAASAAVYLLFSAINFGVWQEWWLALAALVGVMAALLMSPQAADPST